VEASEDRVFLLTQGAFCPFADLPSPPTGWRKSLPSLRLVRMPGWHCDCPRAKIWLRIAEQVLALAQRSQHCDNRTQETVGLAFDGAREGR